MMLVQCSGPVSYTHLDVYKRQILEDVKILGLFPYGTWK